MGAGTLRPAATGVTPQRLRMKREHCSPKYTTCWRELPRAPTTRAGQTTGPALRELDRKLRTDQSPVVDDGNQVAEVDHAIVGDIEDARLCTCDLITQDTCTRPDSFREVTAFHSGRHTNAFDTTRAKPSDSNRLQNNSPAVQVPL